MWEIYTDSTRHRGQSCVCLLQAQAMGRGTSRFCQRVRARRHELQVRIVHVECVASYSNVREGEGKPGKHAIDCKRPVAGICKIQRGDRDTENDEGTLFEMREASWEV